MQARTIFNPTQLHLLKLFAINQTEESLDELKIALMDFYQKRLDKEMDKLWDSGKISNDKLEEIKNMHLRTHTEK